MCSFGVHHSTTLTSKELIPLTRAFHLSLKLKFLLGSSWMARHWWSLQVAPPYTMWEALLCIYLHVSIMWSSTSFKHVILGDSYLELALVNHDHQHLMSSSHRHLKYLSRCEPMRISSQKHRQHIVWVSTQSAIIKFLPYHKISVAHDLCLCVDHLWIQSSIFILVNLNLCSMINLDAQLHVYGIHSESIQYPSCITHGTNLPI